MPEHVLGNPLGDFMKQKKLFSGRVGYLLLFQIVA
jgi:hypothetical protein